MHCAPRSGGPGAEFPGDDGFAGEDGRYGDHPVFLQFEAGEYRDMEPAWAAGGISCKGGWWIAHNRGFYDVDPIDCDGRTFIYSGRWRGRMFKVYIDLRSGHIKGVARG